MSLQEYSELSHYIILSTKLARLSRSSKSARVLKKFLVTIVVQQNWKQIFNAMKQPSNGSSIHLGSFHLSYSDHMDYDLETNHSDFLSNH